MVQHGAHDRLPWLDTPRPVARPRARRATPARHARTPLLVLLGLFAASLLAVMAFLTGRGTAPRPVATAESAAPLPAPAPPPAASPSLAARPAPVEPPRRAEAAPATAPLTASAPQPAPSTAARNPGPKRAYRTASASRQVKARRAAARIARARARQAAVRRNPIPIPAGLAAAPRRATPWPTQFAGPRGKVVQLGAFVTMRQADAAWWRLLRAYPYLGTLPRMVSWIGPTPGRPRYYRVRLAASTRREARALCDNLHRIGRGCMVV